MSKDFRAWKIDEVQLLPPSVQDYVPKDHLSRLIVALERFPKRLTLEGFPCGNESDSRFLLEREASMEWGSRIRRICVYA